MLTAALLFVLIGISADVPCTAASVPASPNPTGPLVHVPGFPGQQGTAVPYDTSLNLASPDNGCARPAVAKDRIGCCEPIHAPEFLNDGYYGNGGSWIGNSSPTWAKIDLGREVILDRITFGRDRFGGSNDRDARRIEVYGAAKEKSYANGDDTDDEKEYRLLCDTADTTYPGFVVWNETYELVLPPETVRFVKIVVHSAGSIAAIDELEVFGYPRHPLEKCSHRNPHATD